MIQVTPVILSVAKEHVSSLYPEQILKNFSF